MYTQLYFCVYELKKKYDCVYSSEAFNFMAIANSLRT